MKRPFLLTLVVVSVLFFGSVYGSGISKEKRTQSGKETSAQHPESAQHQEPSIPLATFQASQAAFLETLRAVQTQAKAEIEQAYAHEDTWHSPSVVAQLLIFAAAVAYTIIASRQLGAIKAQAKIASDTLSLANRPKIKMRGFYVKGDIEQDATGVKNWEMEIGYELVNYGGTEATLIDSRHIVLMNTVGRLPTLTMPPPYGGDQIAPQGTVFEPGKAYSYLMRGTVGPESRAQLQPLIESERRAAAMHFQPYCLGYVAYKGRIGNSYRTAFCRSLSRRMLPRPYVFETSKDPDYEYED